MDCPQKVRHFLGAFFLNKSTSKYEINKIDSLEVSVLASFQVLLFFIFLKLQYYLHSSIEKSREILFFNLYKMIPFLSSELFFNKHFSHGSRLFIKFNQCYRAYRFSIYKSSPKILTGFHIKTYNVLQVRLFFYRYRYVQFSAGY